MIVLLAGLYSNYHNLRASMNSDNLSPSLLEEQPESWPLHFPSIEERVQYYMGDWYTLHQNNNFTVPSNLCDQVARYDATAKATNRIYLFDQKSLKLARRHGALIYSQDALRLYFYPPRHPKNLRILMSFGDSESYKDLPYMVKAREVQGAKRAGHEDSADPILALLNTPRHYGALKYSGYMDRAWHRKRDTVIWRGLSTGRKKLVGNRKEIVAQYWNQSRNDIDIGFTTLLPDNKNGPPVTQEQKARAERPGMYIWQLLQYKYLLSIEGNDVATGLKWMLYSNSVVFMAPPTHVTFAMEDKLVPYYHYVPIKPDLSDIAEQLAWARQNDAECQKIAQQATEYMEALWMSPKAQQANDEIIERITLRYHKLYGSALADC